LTSTRVARGYVHWFIVDPAAMTTSLDENAAVSGLPSGRQLKPYAGPFPPSGTHDYEFTLYAFDRDVSTASAASASADYLTRVQDHILGSPHLTASFTNPRT
jgi:phosphatidylethanolamine-binding protein (PEBP) family uncharacterized protein